MSRRAWIRVIQFWAILPFAFVAGLPGRPVEVWQLILAGALAAVIVDLLLTPWVRSGDRVKTKGRP